MKGGRWEGKFGLVMNLAFCFPQTHPCGIGYRTRAHSQKHTQTHARTHLQLPHVSFSLCHAMRIRATMCHQNEGRKYAKQTIRGVPPGVKQPIMAVPVCVTSQQEAELVLVSSQSPAEWLISLLD